MRKKYTKKKLNEDLEKIKDSLWRQDRWRLLSEKMPPEGKMVSFFQCQNFRYCVGIVNENYKFPEIYDLCYMKKTSLTGKIWWCRTKKEIFLLRFYNYASDALRQAYSLMKNGDSRFDNDAINWGDLSVRDVTITEGIYCKGTFTIWIEEADQYCDSLHIFVREYMRKKGCPDDVEVKTEW